MKASNMVMYSVSEATTRDLAFKSCVHSGLALMHMQYMWFGALRLIGNVCTIVPVSVFVMNDKQHYSKKETNGADCYIRYSQERIFASHPRNCAQDHPFPPIKAVHRIIWHMHRKSTQKYWSCIILNISLNKKG